MSTEQEPPDSERDRLRVERDEARDLYMDAEARCSAGLSKLDAAEAEVERLRAEIDCACNALSDSICVSGNDPETSLVFVRKLRAAITKQEKGDG